MVQQAKPRGDEKSQSKLLDMVIGRWQDASSSTYEVTLDGTSRKPTSTCTVSIMRNGEQQPFTRRGVIKLAPTPSGGSCVTWGQSYVLDVASTTQAYVRWNHNFGGRSFYWSRKAEPGEPGAAKQPAARPLQPQPVGLVQGSPPPNTSTPPSKGWQTSGTAAWPSAKEKQDPAGPKTAASKQALVEKCVEMGFLKEHVQAALAASCAKDLDSVVTWCLNNEREGKPGATAGEAGEDETRIGSGGSVSRTTSDTEEALSGEEAAYLAPGALLLGLLQEDCHRPGPRAQASLPAVPPAARCLSTGWSSYGAAETWPLRDGAAEAWLVPPPAEPQLAARTEQDPLDAMSPQKWLPTPLSTPSTCCGSRGPPLSPSDEAYRWTSEEATPSPGRSLTWDKDALEEMTDVLGEIHEVLLSAEACPLEETVRESHLGLGEHAQQAWGLNPFAQEFRPSVDASSFSASAKEFVPAAIQGDYATKSAIDVQPQSFAQGQPWLTTQAHAASQAAHGSVAAYCQPR